MLQEMESGYVFTGKKKRSCTQVVLSDKTFPAPLSLTEPPALLDRAIYLLTIL